MGRTGGSPGRLRMLLGNDVTVLVRGPAGIGKSTLVRRAVRDRPHVIGQSLHPLMDVPYHPLAHAIGRSFDGPSTDVAGDIAAELAGRTLLVEDIHWSDAESLEVLALLAGRVPLVLTSRGTVPCGTWPHVEILDVDPLEPGAAALLAQRLHPALDPIARRHLVELAGGNPLLIGQLVAGDVVSPTLLDAVRSRVTDLSAVTLEQLATVALYGPPIPIALLEAVGAADVVHAHGLVDEHDGTVAVAHALLADAVVALVDGATRRAIHGRLAAVCDELDTPRHLFEAGFTVTAAARAERSAATAPTAARARLLALAVDARGEGASARLRLDAAAALIAANQPQRAGAIVDPLDGSDPLTCAEAHWYRSQAAWLTGDEVRAEHHCSEALALSAGSGSPLVTRLLIERGTQRVRTRLGDPSVIDDADRAWAAASADGVDRARARNLVGLALAHNGRPGWEAHYLAAAELAREDGDVEQELAAMYWLVSAYGFFGPIQKGMELGPMLIARTEKLGLRQLHHHFLGAFIVARFGTGTAPDEMIARARQLLTDDPLFRNRAQVDVLLAIGLVDRGDPVGAREVLEAGRRFVRNDEERSLLCVGHAELAWAIDDHAALIAALEELGSCTRGFFGMNAFAESAAIHVLLDAPDTTPIPSFGVSLMPNVDVVRTERAGFEAWRRGDASTAIEAFDEAARSWIERGFVRFGARSHLAAGRLARRIGAPDEASRRFWAAAGLAERWRLAPIAGAARRALAELERDGHRSRLSRRELDVLDLVATGCTSPEIAARLGVGESTVVTHLNSARSKLGAQTRMQAASMVATIW